MLVEPLHIFNLVTGIKFQCSLTQKQRLSDTIVTLWPVLVNCDTLSDTWGTSGST